MGMSSEAKLVRRKARQEKFRSKVEKRVLSLLKYAKANKERADRYEKLAKELAEEFDAYREKHPEPAADTSTDADRDPEAGPDVQVREVDQAIETIDSTTDSEGGV